MTKETLRWEARARLRALASPKRERAGTEIARRVWTLPEIAAAHVLLLFASLPTEVPTDAIAREAWQGGIAVLYPRCLTQTGKLVLYRVQDAGDLRPGAYGVREPDPGRCSLARIEEVDAALIPGLAWDRRGGRLGRGGGYYDRLLGAPGWRAFRCGLFFATQEAPLVPVDPWDIRLDAVVTEREVWRRECEPER